MIMFELVREALNDAKFALDVVVPGRLVDYAAKKTKKSVVRLGDISTMVPQFNIRLESCKAVLANCSSRGKCKKRRNLHTE